MRQICPRTKYCTHLKEATPADFVKICHFPELPYFLQNKTATKMLDSISRGGGQRALFDLSFRHATTQTQAYFGVFDFSRKKCREKKTLHWLNCFMKIQWEIHCFTFLNTDRNSSKKIQNRNVGILFSNLLLNQFSTLGSWTALSRYSDSLVYKGNRSFYHTLYQTFCLI